MLKSAVLSKRVASLLTMALVWREYDWLKASLKSLPSARPLEMAFCWMV